MSRELRKYQKDRIEVLGVGIKNFVVTTTYIYPILPLINSFIYGRAFNALYNVLDLPKLAVTRTVNDGKREKPIIRGNGDQNKLINIALKIGEDNDYAEAVQELSERRPFIRANRGRDELLFINK